MTDSVIVPVAQDTPIAVDDIGGIRHQLVKVEFGDTDSATQVSASNPLPVSSTLQAGSAAVGSFRTTPAASSSLTEVSIDFATATTTAVVSATASQTTRLYKLQLMVGGATTLTWKDGSTALHGGYPMQAGATITLDFDGEPWFTTSANSALNLTSSAAVQVSGRAYYVKS